MLVNLLMCEPRLRPRLCWQRLAPPSDWSRPYACNGRRWSLERSAGRTCAGRRAARVCGRHGDGDGAGQCPARLAGTEFGIARSVLLLGVTIALEQKGVPWIAASGVGLFGLCHGYAHGAEMPVNEQVGRYAAGFLITTAGLHLVGAVGGLLLRESRRGKRWLGLAGVTIAVIGAYLIIKGPVFGR
jgi:hypothetical protein